MKLIEITVRSEEGELPYERQENRITAQAAGKNVVCRVTYSFPFRSGDKLFVNGYQGWTYSPEREIGETDLAMRYCPAAFDKTYGFSRYGDGHFYKKTYRRGWLHGYTYAYIRRDEEYFFIGSLNEDTAFLRIIFDTERDLITLESDLDGRAVDKGFPLMNFCMYRGSETSVFDRWFAEMKIPAVRVGKRCGYTSWYRHYQNITQDIIFNDLKGLQSLPLKSDVFQIDDGYETKVGDWLSVDQEKFPEGLQPVVNAIREAKYRPGIWLAPFVCEKESSLYREHFDWLLKGEDGEPVYAGSNWSGAYALDFSKQEVREYVEKCVRHYREMGFSFFKFDFLYAVCMRPNEKQTRAEIMAEAMKFLRKLCGKDLILGCGVPLSSAFGRVDYCRIGMDVSLKYDDELYMRPFHNERPSTKNALRNTVYRRQLSGRAFLNDPDVFLLRDGENKLSREQKRTLAVVNALFGGVLFSSDDFGEYDEEKRSFYSYLVSLQNAVVTSVRQEKKTLVVAFTLGGENRTETLVFA